MSICMFFIILLNFMSKYLKQVIANLFDTLKVTL